VICGDRLKKGRELEVTARARPVPVNRVYYRLICCAQLTSTSKPALGSPPPLTLSRLLISSISVQLVMTENQVKVPVDSCYQVKCDKCDKTTWKVNRSFDAL
jgi:hypothetical protein